MGEIDVDPEALLTLSGRMAGTRDRVGAAVNAMSPGQECGGLLGPAVARFADHWSYGLRRIATNLHEAEEALRQAAQAYRDTDDAIARAAG